MGEKSPTFALSPENSPIAILALSNIAESETPPSSVDQFVSMFEGIYGAAHATLGIQAVALRFFEEVGEVANAIRTTTGSMCTGNPEDLKALDAEIADVFSWVCMLFIKLQSLIPARSWVLANGERGQSARPLDLSSLLWAIYGAQKGHIVCPSCGLAPCVEDVPERSARSSRPEEPAVSRRLIITIDGPVASGKSSVARRVAELLGYIYVDSGAMYRAFALKALRCAAPLHSPKDLDSLATRTRIDMVPSDANSKILLDGVDVTSDIRTPEVSLAASKVALVPAVRRMLMLEQRRAGLRGNVVMEGRDIGTVVFPHADLKIFLDASVEVRAERRWREHQKEGEAIGLARTIEEVRERDRRDREREVSPLVQAADAVLVDNSAMNVEETARLIVMLAQEKETK